MIISLDPKWEQFITEKVKSGEFPSADFLIAAALERMQQDTTTADYNAYVKREVAKGIDQADQGDFVQFDAESVIAEGRARRTRGAN
jgi:putative addiction module CopG family antidote